MTEYLVTDTTTGAKTWISASSKREACILHENARREAGGPFRSDSRPLPFTSKASHDRMRVSVADSAVIGLNEWVVR